MRNMILIIAMFFVVFVGCNLHTTQYDVCYAINNTQDDVSVEQELNDEINNQLTELDTNEYEEIVSNLSNSQSSIFGANSFFDKLTKIISGEFSNNQTSVWSAIVSLLFEDVLDFMPMISLVIAIAVVFSLVSSSKPKFKSKSIGDIIHFACYGAIIVILSATIVSMIMLTKNTIGSLKTQIDVSFPLLLTMLTAIGGVVSVGVFQPAVALLGGSIINIFTSILLPLVIFSFIFNILSNLSSSVKFDKFSSFFNSSFKWIIGIIFTIFSAFISIQGITAGSVDGISIKTAKYAIKGVVPILGGYLSDGLNLIMASSVLIKNAIGASGLLILLLTILAPIIKLIILSLTLKFASAVLEPVTDSRISNCISSVSKSVTMLIVLILGIAFMYFILTGIIMCSANYL